MTSGRAVRAAAALLLAGGWSAQAHAVPVRLIPNLVSVTFYERTGGVAPTPFTFAVNGPELTTRLANPLGPGNADMAGAATEFYDVFYSNADGSFNPDGEYLTIEGVYGQTLPQGGGLNLAEIALNFSSAPSEFGSFVASSLALGDNAVPGDVGRSIDGDLQTHTTMGNTVGQTQRLRVTLGFVSATSPPAPTSTAEIPTLSQWVLVVLGGLVGASGWVAARHRRRS